MTDLFLRVVELSWQAGVLALAVMLTRLCKETGTISRTATRQITSVSRAPSSVPREILPRCRADRSSF